MSKRWILLIIIASALILLGWRFVSATVWGKTCGTGLSCWSCPSSWRWSLCGSAPRSARDDRDAADKRAQIDREIATDRLQDAALQAYYDKMTELLLKENLRDAPAGEEVISIARSRTRATLRSLDNVRKGLLVEFLHEARLIDKQNPIILLEGADLTGAS